VKDNGKQLPKVSAIIPMYNVEKTIDKCVESLLQQTYRNIEIIAVDDGSTDKTKDIVRRYPVKLIERRHRGAPAAMNEGFRHSMGDVIFFVEADGYYAANYFELCLPHLKDPTVGTVIGALHAWPDTSLLYKFWESMRKLILVNYEPLGGWFFRGKDLEKAGLYNEKIRRGWDIEFCTRLKQKLGYKFAYEPRAVWWHKYDCSMMGILKKHFKYGRNVITNPILRKKSIKETSVTCLSLILSTFVTTYSLLNNFFIPIIALIIMTLLMLHLLAIYRVSKARQPLNQHAVYILLFPIVGILSKIAFSLGFILSSFRNLARAVLR